MKPQIILIVEDDADDELLTTKGLRQSGLPVQVALLRDGADALNRLLNPLEPVPHLIVLDYRMPVVNGLQVLNAVRAAPHTRYVPVVMLSSALSPSQVCECLALGANCCMLKPVDPEKYVADVALMVRFWLTVCLAVDQIPAQDAEPLPRPDRNPVAAHRSASGRRAKDRIYTVLPDPASDGVA